MSEIIRTEFGARRTQCACQVCVNNCRYIPGYLIPADLDRLIPPDCDPFEWAAIHLDASPGAIVMTRQTGRMLRVPTLVPRTAGPGLTACHWLDAQDRCTVHADAPFGCAFFSACDRDGSELTDLPIKGLMAVYQAHIEEPPSLYSRLWQWLEEAGFQSPPPEVKRAALKAANLKFKQL